MKLANVKVLLAPTAIADLVVPHSPRDPQVSGEVCSAATLYALPCTLNLEP